MSQKPSVRRPNQFMMETFTFFWDGPFSQWHPCSFRLDGERYNCAEQFMMAEKARYFMDDDVLNAIMRAAHPHDQKQLGREASGFDTAEWEHKESNGRPYCWNVVYRANVAKFSQDPQLFKVCLLYTSPSPRDATLSRMPSSA